LTRALAEVLVEGTENATDTGSEALSENTTDTSSEALVEGPGGDAEQARLEESQSSVDSSQVQLREAEMPEEQVEDVEVGSRRYTEFADAEIQAQANTPDIDPSLLFGMERTLYSAVNVGALVIMFGFGLMMVSPAHFQQYYIQGCIIAVAGLTFIGCSWLNHFMRMRILSQGGQVTICNSAAWTGCLMFLMCVCVCLELYYGYTHPYMERSMPVDVNNPNSGLPAMTTSAP
jgi:hypothetical protein